MEPRKLEPVNPLRELNFACVLLQSHFYDMNSTDRVFCSIPDDSEIFSVHPREVPKEANVLTEGPVVEWLVSRALEASQALSELLRTHPDTPQNLAFADSCERIIQEIFSHFQVGFVGNTFGDLPMIGMNKVDHEDYGIVGRDYTMEWDPEPYELRYKWFSTGGQGVVRRMVYEQREIPKGDHPVRMTRKQREDKKLLSAFRDDREKFVDNLDPEDYLRDDERFDPWMIVYVTEGL